MPVILKKALLFLLMVLLTLGTGVGPVCAVATYQAVGTNAVTSGIQDLGRLRIDIPTPEVPDNYYFLVGFPDRFSFNLNQDALYPLNGAGPEFTLDGNNHMTITIPQAHNAFYDSAGTYGNASINIEALTNNQIRVNIQPSAVVNNSEEKAYMYLNLKGITVPDSSPPTIQATVEGPGFSPQSASEPNPAPAVLLEFSAEGGVVDSPSGVRDLAIHPLIIREGIKSAINPDTENGRLRNTVRIEFPSGVTCSAPTGVEVTSGDIVIDQTSLCSEYDPEQDRWGVEFNIKSSSTRPSTVKINGIKLDLSRELEKGKIQAYLKGDAIIKTLDEFPGQTSISSTPVVNIINSIPADVSREICFFISRTDYIVNGVEKRMDVAPLIRNNRTLLPVSFAARALDISVAWDEAGQTVTLIRDDRIVQFSIGKTMARVGNIEVIMEAAPEIENGRTMVPAGFLAQTLGYQISWDEAARSIVIE